MLSYFIPELFLGIGALILLLINVFFNISNSKSFIAWILLLFTTCFLFFLNDYTYFYTFNKFIFNPYFVYLKLFLLITTIFLFFSIKHLLINYKYINELNFFITVNLSFQCILINTIDLFIAFILIEAISFSFYLLVSFLKRDLLSVEAGLKYFYLGTISAFIFFLGIYFVYHASLELSLYKILQISDHHYLRENYLTLGLLLILISLIFKLGGSPFHFWVPEVYQGAPIFILPILISLSKLTFTVFLTNVLFLVIQIQSKLTVDFYILNLILAIFAVLSMLIGNFLGIKQNEVKRILSYSSIAHIGYLLSLFSLPWTKTNLEIAYGYIFIYALCNYIFLIGFLYSINSESISSKFYIDKTSFIISSKNLFILIGIIISIISLAGLPPTAGFIVKLMIIIQLFKQNFYLIALIFLITSILSLYYYFKLLLPFFRYISSTDRLLSIRFNFTEILLSVLMIFISFYLIFSTFNFKFIFFVKL